MGVNCLDMATGAIHPTGYHSVRPARQRPGFVNGDDSALAVLLYRVLDYVTDSQLGGVHSAPHSNPVCSYVGAGARVSGGRV